MSPLRGCIILMKDYTLLKPIRWLSCRLLDAVIRKQRSVVVCIHSNPRRYKIDKNKSLAVPEDVGRDLPYWWLNFEFLRRRRCHVLSAVAKTTSPFKYMWTRQTAILKHCSKSAMNFSTGNIFRNQKFKYYSPSSCMPTSSVDILNNNDVINDVVIITQGMWSTQYMSQLQNIEQFLSFTSDTKNLAVLKFIECPSYCWFFTISVSWLDSHDNGRETSLPPESVDQEWMRPFDDCFRLGQFFSTWMLLKCIWSVKKRNKCLLYIPSSEAVNISMHLSLFADSFTNY